jgi:glycine/D-amino acid oxidase-like deaminating enzyme
MPTRRSSTKYGRSPWVDRFPKSRIPTYPRLRGPLAADIVIVGGGLTGCATAFAFAAAGISTVLLERDQIGRGSTAAAAGLIAADLGLGAAILEKAIGVRSARRAAEAWRRAALDFAALLRRLRVKCDLEPRRAFSASIGGEQMVALERERKARRAAGMETPFLSARAAGTELGLESSGAIRVDDVATIDPYRACLGLAAAARSRGAVLFERSPVQRITFDSNAVHLVVDGGTIRAGRVIVATGMPTALFKALIRHFWLRTTYLAVTAPIPARIRQRLAKPAAVWRDFANPPHVVRWLDDDRLMVMGADRETPPAPQREKTDIQRTGQLMYELSLLYPDISGILPEYGWDAPYARTDDGLPAIGPHRNFPRHLFAFGDGSHSVTGAFLASRILLRHYQGTADTVDEVFGFARSLARA